MSRLQKNMKVWLIACSFMLVAGLIATLHFSSAQETPPPAKVVISNNLKEQGKQLRAAIDQAYKKMNAAHAIKTAVHQGDNDLTPVVIKYIPPGISFDDAEAILRSAGFKIWPRPDPNSPKIWDGYSDHVVAAIDPYVTMFLFGKTSIYVDLIPQTPGDYTKVSRIEAGIGVSTL